MSKSSFELRGSGRTRLESGIDREAVKRAISALEHLEPGWDHRGATVPDPAVVDSARRVVDYLPDRGVPVPCVVPMSGGRLQLEWHRGARTLELEFENASVIRFLKWDKALGIVDEDVVSVDDRRAILTLVEWFTSE